MEEVTINVGGQILSLPADAILPNTNLVVSNGNMLNSTGPGLNDSSATFVTLPVPWILRDGTLLNNMSSSQGIILKQHGNTFLLDANQFPLLSDDNRTHFVLTTDAFGDELQPVDVLDDSLHEISQLDQALPITGILPAVNNDQNLEPNHVSDHFLVSKSKTTTETKRGPGRPKRNDDTILPPIGKGPFKCDSCEKEFPKWQLLVRHSKTHVDDKPFVCPKCYVTFNVESNLVLHSAIHNLEDLTCPECHRHFSRVASLKAHILLHEKEENVFCSECGDEFFTATQLEDHQKAHVAEWASETQSYDCPHCDRTFNRLWKLREHNKEHFKVKTSLARRTYTKHNGACFVHKCSNCDKTFQKPSQLERHLRIHTGERPFKCNSCDKAFNQKGALHIHMTKHTGCKPHTCTFCKMTFSQKGNLRAHIQRVHTIPSANEQVYQCHECPCVFRKLGSLNAHLSRMHCTSNKGNVMDKDGKRDMSAVVKQLLELCAEQQCIEVETPLNINTDILQMALTSSGLTVKPDNQDSTKSRSSVLLATLVDKAIDGTVRKHTVRGRIVGGIRWHQCTHCTKEFRKPSDLVRHIRTHTLEKPFKCTSCFRSFTVKSTLTAHIRTHTGQKDFTCQTCNKKFASASSLTVHDRLHTGSKPYSCSYCGKQFRTIGHCKLHEVYHTQKTKKTDNSDKQSEKKTSAKSKAPTASELGAMNNIVLQEPIVVTNTGLYTTERRRKHFLPENSTGGTDRPYRCVLCLAAFKKTSHLKQHVRSHTGEKPFKCTECSRSFVSNGVLKAHIRTHDRTHVHICSVCTRSFTTHGSLRRHMAIHSDARPYMCPYCQKMFKTPVNCRKHMKTHLAELMSSQTKESTTGTSGEYKDENIITATFDTSDLGERYTSDVAMNDTNPEENQNTTHIGLTLTTLSGTGSLSPESLRQLEQTLNQQVFGPVDNNSDNPTTTSFTLTTNNNVRPIVISDDTMLVAANDININGNAEVTVMQSSNHAASPKKDDLPPEEKQEEVTIPSSLFGQAFDGTNFDTFSCTDDLMAGLGQSGTLPTGHFIIAGTPPPPLDEDDHLRQQDSDEDVQRDMEILPAVTPGLKMHRCPFCGRGFSRLSVLKQHKKIHHSKADKPFQCYACTRYFTNMNQLQEHKNIHDPEPDENGSRIFKCDIPKCKKTFTRKAPFVKHLRTHVENSDSDNDEIIDSVPKFINNIPQPEDEKENAKTISEKVLEASVAEKDRISEIKDPYQGIEDLPRFANQCPDCPKSFKKPSDLVRHIRIHTGERPFVCDLCCKTFTVKSTLDSHTKTHLGAKLFSCHVCNNVFATKGSLKVHMRLHTGSKPFKCSHCDLRFRTSGHRKAHMTSHFKCVSRNNGTGVRRKKTVTTNNILLSEDGGVKNMHTIMRQTSPLMEVDEVNVEQSLPLLNADGSELIGSIQLSVAPNGLGNELQIMAFDTNVLSHQSFEIDSALFQQLTQGTTLEENEKESEAASETRVEKVDIAPQVCPVSSQSVRYEVQTDEQGQIINIRMDSIVPEQQIPMSPSKRGKATAHPCPMCTKMFTKPSQLQRHLRVHTGERPFQCSQCNRSFNQKNALAIHMAKHTGDRPYVCMYCEHTFTQRGNLKTHIRRQHPEMTFQEIGTGQFLDEDLSDREDKLMGEIDGDMGDLFSQVSGT